MALVTKNLKKYHGFRHGGSGCHRDLDIDSELSLLPALPLADKVGLTSQTSILPLLHPTKRGLSPVFPIKLLELTLLG